MVDFSLYIIKKAKQLPSYLAFSFILLYFAANNYREITISYYKKVIL